MSFNRIVVIISVVVAGAGHAGTARAQVVAPSTANHVDLGRTSGSVNVAGGYSASVPIGLPSPRGRFDVPLAVEYTGSTQAGAVGAGWDIPISSVRVSRTSWHRKPAAQLNASGGAFVPERIVVTLGGATFAMLPSPRPGVYVAFQTDEYLELHATDTGWTLSTSSGVDYEFRGAADVGANNFDDSDLALLTTVRDTVSGDRAELRYSTTDHGCGPELDLAGIAYTFDASGDALYDVELLYAPNWVDVDVRPDGPQPCWPLRVEDGQQQGLKPLAITDADGYTIPRSQVLEALVVRARDNLDNAVPRAARRIVSQHRFTYEDDRDTGLPRLASVEISGEEGASPATPLKLGSYRYGSVTADDGDIYFGPPEHLPRTADAVAAGKDGLAESHTDSEEYAGPLGLIRIDRVRTTQIVLDLTGDNLPDLVWKHGDTWHLQQGVVTEDGPSFEAGPQTTWAQPSEIHWEETRRVVRAPPDLFADSRSSREAMVTRETLVQVVDWNGDGRMDIVDAPGGSDLRHWRVWLNRPDPVAILRFDPVQVDVGTFIDLLEDEGIVLDYLQSGQPTRFPIERSRSWPRVEAFVCEMYQDADGIWQSCADEDVIVDDDRSDTVTEWSVQDMNGDSYPDLIASRVPVIECEKVPVEPCEYNPPSDPSDPNYGACVGYAFEIDGQVRPVTASRYAQWLSSTGECAEVNPPSTMPARVFVNRWGALAHVDLDGAYWEDVTIDADGLARWSTADSMREMFGGDEQTDVSRNVTGFVDLQGFGIPTHSSGVLGTFQEDGCGSFQTSGFFDLNGDGTLDSISRWTDGWHVSFRTNAGAGESRRVRWERFGNPALVGFELSKTESSCGADSTTVARLIDLDGDGKPEMVERGPDGELYFTRLVKPIGPPGAEVPMPVGVDSGRLVAILNGYGAERSIEYANNKAVGATSHQVPAPEIVVAQTRVRVSDGSAVDGALVQYAHGVPEMRYDPLFDRVRFAGYRRSVTLVSDSRSAVATIVDRRRQSLPFEDLSEFAIGGRVERISRLEGVTGDDPNDLLDTITVNHGTIDPRIRAQTETSWGVTEQSLRAYGGADGDCIDVDLDQALPAGLLCWHATVVHPTGDTTWEGIRPQPWDSNVSKATEIIAVDERGRPTQIENHGDLTTFADDTCTTIDYATSGSALSAVAGIHVDDCGRSNRTPPEPVVIAGTRFIYDDRPEGEVGRGRLTSKIIENYDVSDGSTLGEHVVMTLEYDDDLGVVSRSTSSRLLGTPTTRVTTIDHDAFGLTKTQLITTATDVAAGEFVQTQEQSTWTWKPVISRGVNGEEMVTHRDAFGRTTRIELVDGGTRHTSLERSYVDDPSGREVIETSYPATSDLPQTSHIHLDALGRARFRQTELGADYGSTTLITGLVEYDGYGRVAYHADPFEWPELPFTPDSLPPVRALWPYGVTFVHDAGGRLARQIEAPGVRPELVHSSVPANVFVTSVSHTWDAGRATTRVSGPRENDPTSAVFGAYTESQLTAIGWPVETAHFDVSGERVDLVRHEFDRLGHETRTRRYRDPAGATDVVDWTSRHDSAGRVLARQEAGSATVRTMYDEWGSVIETSWSQGTSTRVQRRRHDGLGREVGITLLTTGPSGDTVEWEEQYHYDLHSGEPLQPDGPLLGRLSRIETLDVGDAYFGYDAFGRTTSETYLLSRHGDPMHTRRAYAPGGTLQSLELETPAGVDLIAYELDTAARVAAVVDAGANTTLFRARAIDPEGRYLDSVLGNGVKQLRDFAATGREQLIEERWNGDSVDTSHVLTSFDADGRVLAETWTSGSAIDVASSYDVLGRLTRQLQPGQDERFTYDSLGNITEKRNTLAPSTERDFLYDASDRDRLCRVVAPGQTPAGCDLGHDTVGNVVVDLSTGVPRTFTYDAASRVTRVDRGDRRAEFSYGPGGTLARTQVWDGTELEAETWSFGSLIEQRTRADGEVQIDRRIPGPQGLLATLRTDGTSQETVYVHGDVRGNRFFSIADGSISQSVKYRAFGTVLEDSGDPSSIAHSDDLWNGGDDLRDLGVVVLGARIYDPVLGRFLQRDPIIANRSANAGNPYSFSLNDPVNFADPSGLSPCSFLSICANIGRAFSGFSGSTASAEPSPEQIAAAATMMVAVSALNVFIESRVAADGSRDKHRETLTVPDFTEGTDVGILDVNWPGVFQPQFFLGAQDSVRDPILAGLDRVLTCQDVIACVRAQGDDAKGFYEGIGHQWDSPYDRVTALGHDNFQRGLGNLTASVAGARFGPRLNSGPVSLPRLGRVSNGQFVYQLVDDVGDPVYYGISNDPVRRLGEHALAPPGPFRGMQVISGELPQAQARALETSLIQQALDEGRPIYNTAPRSISAVWPVEIPTAVTPTLTLLNPQLYSW